MIYPESQTGLLAQSITVFDSHADGWVFYSSIDRPK